MNRLVKKTFLCMGEMFDLTPREKSDTWKRLSAMRTQLSPERDCDSIREYFESAFEYIGKAMENINGTKLS